MVASLPRDQRCWHIRPPKAVSLRPLSHRFREINAVGTMRPPQARDSKAVASLPRDQRCWHDKQDGVDVRVPRSHRFREINAVGTACCSSSETTT